MDSMIKKHLIGAAIIIVIALIIWAEVFYLKSSNKANQEPSNQTTTQSSSLSE